MKLLYRSTAYFVIESTIYSTFKVETDGETLYVRISPFWYNTNSYSAGLSVPITYNGETKSLTTDVFDGEVTVTFGYSDSVKSLHVGCNVSVDYDDYPDGTDITWKGSFSDPTPTLSVSIEGIRQENTNVTLSWEIGAPEGYYSYLTNINYGYIGVSDGVYRDKIRWVRPQKVEGNSVNYYYSLTAGDRIKLKVFAAIYRSADDAAGDYVGIAEAETQWITVAAQNQLYAPYNLQTSRPVAGTSVTVTWKKPNDPGPSSGYTTVSQLEKSVDGGDFTLLYTGSAESYVDTLSTTQSTVAYRVKIPGVSYFSDSAWCETGVISVIKTNVYIGTRPAAGIYLGTATGVKSLIPIMKVGR